MRDYFPLDSITAIAISGKDRLKWLNNLVTNDLRQTSENRAVECFVTDVKGRTLSHGIVFSDQESLVYFSWGRDQASKLLPHWDRYIIREDVVIADESSKWPWGFVRRSWLTEQLCDQRFSKLTDMEVTSIDDSTIAIACPAIGQEWFLMRFAPEDSLRQLLTERFAELNAQDAFDLEAMRIRHRWPLVGLDFDDKNLPQELDRNASAISFNKGCYLGQETVARLDALGQVQKKLVRLSIDITDRMNCLAFQRGAIVKKDDQEAGMLTSFGGFDESGGFMALAYIRRAYFAAGTELHCNGFRAVVQATA